MIFKIILSAIFLICVTSTGFPVEVTQIEVLGSGLTRQEAIYAGLIEAVRQVNGVEIASKTQTNFSYKEFAASHGTEQKEGSIGKNSIKKDIFAKSKGFVQKYDIIDTHTANNQWEITLLVSIPKYKTPGISPHSRRKIAIIPFRTTKGSYNFRGGHIASSEISRQFTQKLVTEMTQTRRFTVLDREYIEEFFQEKNFILSADAPVSEQMKIGEVLGVDYLLIGTISEASQKQIPYIINVTGETGYNYSASFIADYRIIVMATRQIKWADSVRISLGDAEIKSMAPGFGTDQMQQALLDEAAKQIVHKAMENIYPLMVVKVQPNGEVILNQGGATISDGEMLDVFTKGKKVFDPYTGESLGSSESRIATIKIVRVIPKMSYATVIKGQLEAIKKGSICRRLTKKKEPVLQSPPGRKTDIEPTPKGGVILPFD